MRIKDKDTATRILTSEKSSQEMKNQAAKWISEKYNESIRKELLDKKILVKEG